MKRFENMENRKMKKQRTEIDKIDEDIVKLLAKRTNIVREMAKEKLDNKINVQDKEREKEIFSKLKYHAYRYSIDYNFIKEFFSFIEKRVGLIPLALA